jgi:hypothetical protein
MTRSNIHIHLSNGYYLECVAESSTAPEQGYFVEHFVLPLFALRDPFKEAEFLTDNCTMNEQRTNATYRYVIDLGKRKLQFYEENYDEGKDAFFKGKNITSRFNAYCMGIHALRPLLDQINFPEN